jgi:cell division protein FtsL
VTKIFSKDLLRKLRMILMLFAAVISSSTDGVRWMVKRVDVEAVSKMNCETVGKID